MTVFVGLEKGLDTCDGVYGGEGSASSKILVGFYDTHERRPTPLIPTLYNIKYKIDCPYTHLPVKFDYLLSLVNS